MKRRRPRRTDLWPRSYRRNPAGVLAILIIAALVVYFRRQNPAPPAGSDYERYNNQTATCTKVVDGDTLYIKIPDGTDPHTKVRLWGVDTPEIAHGGQKAMYFGPEAAKFVRSEVGGKPVRVVLAPNDTRDRYNRLLAYIYYGQPEEMLNEQLLIEGLAYADPRFAHPWKERFLDLEARARRNRVGLWAKVRPEQMPAWKRKQMPSD